MNCILVVANLATPKTGQTRHNPGQTSAKTVLAENRASKKMRANEPLKIKICFGLKILPGSKTKSCLSRNTGLGNWHLNNLVFITKFLFCVNMFNVLAHYRLI
jgi:hypothetical protein